MEGGMGWMVKSSGGVEVMRRPVVESAALLNASRAATVKLATVKAVTPCASLVALPELLVEKPSENTRHCPLEITV